MARSNALVLVILALCLAATPALARKSSARRLNSGYPKYGSSPSSGSSPAVSSPSPVVSSPSPVVSDTPPYSSSPSTGSSPSSSSPSSTPSITVPPVTSSPSPVTIPPVTSTPSGGYGGYGSRSGMGTSGFFGSNPGRIPRLLSLVSTLAKLFGPRLLKFFSRGKSPTLYAALKDTSPLPMPSLAREASASLINSYAHTDFPLTSGQVIAQFNQALESPEAAAQQALVFQHLNAGV